MTQAFNLMAEAMTPVRGMYAYMPNLPQVHNAVLTGDDVVSGDFVKLDTTSENSVAPEVEKCEVTDVPYGMVVYNTLNNTHTAGDRLALAQTGDSVFLVANNAIAVGAKLQFTADGYVDDTTTSANAYIGIAETVATAKGDLVQVKLNFGLGVAE